MVNLIKPRRCPAFGHKMDEQGHITAAFFDGQMHFLPFACIKKI
jgi:hypothetical protein